MKYSIAFGADENYASHLAAAITSLLFNNREIEFTIYLITSGVSNASLVKLRNCASKYKAEVREVVISEDMFNSLITCHHFTKAMYYRLLIPDLVQEERVLYLDADTIVTSSIYDLLKTNIDDVYVAAVLNPGFDRHKDLNMRSESSYFNSGVMLINCMRWREDNISKRVIDFIDKNVHKVKYPDQCGLNAIIDGSWKRIPLKYNQQAVIFENKFGLKSTDFSTAEISEAKANPVIVHYTGSTKPWQMGSKHPYKKDYWKYRKMTPFSSLFPDDFNIFSFFKLIMPQSFKKRIKKYLRLGIGK